MESGDGLDGQIDEEPDALVELMGSYHDDDHEETWQLGVHVEWFHDDASLLIRRLPLLLLVCLKF